MRDNCLLHYFIEHFFHASYDHMWLTEKHTKVIHVQVLCTHLSRSHLQVLVTIERNGYVTQVCPESVPTSNEVELPDTLRREVNSAVQKEIKRKREMELVEESENILTSHWQIERMSRTEYSALIYWPWLCMCAPALFKQAFILQWLNFG